MTPSPLFFDSHAHLDSYQDELPEVLGRAAAAGVSRIIQIGLGPDRADLEKSLSLVSQDVEIFSLIGLHPHEARAYTKETVPILRELLNHPQVVGIGEIGLDYHYENSPREDQQVVFSQMLDLALEADLPVSIHSREAFDDTCRILAEKELLKSSGGVLHCFTGTAEEARKFLDLGAHISFSGIISFANAKDVIKAAEAVPADRILIETDSPYLAPVPFRGKRNEPSFVVHVAQALAKIRRVPVEELSKITAENTAKLFRLPPYSG